MPDTGGNKMDDLEQLRANKIKYMRERRQWIIQKDDMPEYAYLSVLKMYNRIINSLNEKILNAELKLYQNMH